MSGGQDYHDRKGLPEPESRADPPSLKIDVEITMHPSGALTGRVKDPEAAWRALRPPEVIDPPRGCEEPTGVAGVRPHAKPCRCPLRSGFHNCTPDCSCWPCPDMVRLTLDGPKTVEGGAGPPLDLPASHDRCGTCQGHGYVPVVTSWSCTVCGQIVAQSGAYVRVTAHRVRHAVGSPVCRTQ